MRHRQRRKSFRRSHNHRKALFRNLLVSLVEHGRIKTTLEKAKEFRRYAERAVTIAKRGNINSRRVLLAKYPHKKTVTELFNTISPQFKDRHGGYTRIIKAGRRVGDNARLAFIEWVNFTGVSGKKKTPTTKNPNKADTKTTKAST